MTANKSQFYHSEAEKFRRMAVSATCPDAREYYQALERDFIKLAAGPNCASTGRRIEAGIPRFTPDCFKRVSS
jgi:hypothetical protein